MADWIESSIVFTDEEVSKIEIIDILCENEYYESQDFATEQVEICWSEIDRRASWMGSGSPIIVDGLKIRKSLDINNIAHSFCLMLSRSDYYDKWSTQFGTDFNEQGNLFEDLTCQSLSVHGWKIYQTGWANAVKNKISDSETTVFRGLIANIAGILNESPGGNIEKWINDKTNEAGLDIVSYKPFTDDRPGIPTFFVQCASGAKWKEKLKEPDLAYWSKMIDFSIVPQKAISIPFSLDSDNLRRDTNRYEGMIIDRYRILSAGSTGINWVTEALSEKITAWLEPRVKKLQTL